MVNAAFRQYEPLLRELSEAELRREIDAPDRLLIEAEIVGRRRIEIAYTPFDHVNPLARIAIVGITPGRHQMRNAVLEASRQLKAGADPATALAAAKKHAAFSGPLRANLVSLLDFVGVNGLLGIRSTGQFWDDRYDLVQFASAIRYATFVDGANYSGSPSMMKTEILKAVWSRVLVDELRQLDGAVIVPLGPKVTEVVTEAVDRAGVSRTRILAGLPHPSGANAERIAYFLGRKPRETLSDRTNPDLLDRSRAALLEQIGGLRE
ncbi:MAG: hypothetical protein ACMVY4_06005 [Minwuia sp.]|uniref:hypothetical protein n=1 Tax=Minwuia sp. TaxID=2493630 RepID=UPI003A8BB3A3